MEFPCITCGKALEIPIGEGVVPLPICMECNEKRPKRNVEFQDDLEILANFYGFVSEFLILYANDCNSGEDVDQVVKVLRSIANGVAPVVNQFSLQKQEKIARHAPQF